MIQEKYGKMGGVALGALVEGREKAPTLRVCSWFVCLSYVGSTPHPVTVTTRIATFFSHWHPGLGGRSKSWVSCLSRCLSRGLFELLNKYQTDAGMSDLKRRFDKYKRKENDQRRGFVPVKV